MGASRKLQREIDRVLKKVQEGVDVFNFIWNKVYDTDNANQKEKSEADLKKEIKKLQRYRDHIKTWIQSSEIKDKKALMDARKLIEKEMERFKICEKETKTKAFSKESLEQQPKTDPKEKAKSETRDWLNNMVSVLESEIDKFEAEKEGLSAKNGKTRQRKLTHLESSITRHKAHIMKLELILRLVDNDELTPEQVNGIKKSLDDYVKRNQEYFDDFNDVDILYSTLPLDKVDSLEDLVAIGPPGLVKGVGSASGLSLKSALSTNSPQVPATITSSNQQGDSVHDQVDEAGPQDGISEFGARTPPPKNATSSSAPPTSAGTHAAPVTIGVSSVLPGSSSVNGILDNSTLSVSCSRINIPAKEKEISSIPGRKPSSALPEAGLRNLGRGGVANIPAITIPITSGGAASSSGSLAVASETPRRALMGADVRLGSRGIVQPLVSPLSSRMRLPQSGKTSDVKGGDGGGNAEAGGVAGRVFSSSGVPGMQWRPGTPFQSQHEGFRGITEIAPDQRETFLQRFQQVQQGQGTLRGMPSLSGGNHKQFTTQQNRLQQAGVSGSVSEPAHVTRDIDLSTGQPLRSSQPPSLGPGVIGRRSVSDLGAIGDSLGASALTYGASHDQQTTMQLLESSLYKLPQPKDSERAKIYTPRRPAVTPQSYPQAQAPIVSNPAFWERLGSDNIGTDTLFFAFYYQQRTYQQYLAAKELKKQSWRFHKKYNTWFQRHEVPKIATDDYEQGTYVYFDFHMGNDEMQHGWCQIIKTDFKFEYKFLEDELVV